MTVPSASDVRPVFVGSWNARPAMSKAAELVRSGSALLDALVAGVGVVEDDPTEMSVGFGGLPNEEGEAELDAAVMDGPLHKVGAVAGLRRVRHASAVALGVLRRTDHALLVGQGARRFALQLGFKDEDLSTPASREAWLAWKAGLSTKDAWLAPDEQATHFDPARWAGARTNATPGKPPDVPFTFGTIHVSGLDEAGNLFAVTSTSGLSYKISGRVGDTPIVGGGLFVDNGVGSAGATGRGEASLQNCAAYEAVRGMEGGLSPARACAAALERIVKRTRERRLLDASGRPSFNVTLYALRKDGQTGAASIHPGYEFVVQRGETAVVEHAGAIGLPSEHPAP